MITATSTPTYISKDETLTVYETTVQVKTSSTAQTIAELQGILKSILSSTRLNLDEAVRISEIMAEEANTLALNVKRMMGGENNDKDQDIGSAGVQTPAEE